MTGQGRQNFLGQMAGHLYYLKYLQIFYMYTSGAGLYT